MANSKRKCRYCKPAKYDRPENMVITNGAAFCNLDEATKYARAKIPATREKLKQQERRDFRKGRREYLDNDHAHQVKLTQRRFNELVRLLDEGERCISEGEKPCNGHSWDAGHFITRGASSFLRFNFLNCYRQCSSCNRGEEKHRANAKTVRKRYEENLIQRMGQEVVDWLHAHKHTVCVYSIDELKQMRAMYAAEIRYINEHGKPSRDWRQFPPLEAAA